MRVACFCIIVKVQWPCRTCCRIFSFFYCRVSKISFH